MSLLVGPRDREMGRAAVDGQAPPIVGTTLDGASFDLAAYRGRPVLINFWGPSCVPCRDEFPLLLAKLAEHAADQFAIIGVLTDDPPEPARQFVAEFGATWPTVQDPDRALKTAYRVAGRPQTYFVDGALAVTAAQTAVGGDVVLSDTAATPVAFATIKVSKGTDFVKVSPATGMTSSNWCIEFTNAEGDLKTYSYSATGGLAQAACP